MSSVSSGTLTRLLREPILHFAFAAGALFLLEHYFVAPQKPQIVVGQETIDYLIRQQEELQLRTLSDSERTDLINNYIDEEILYAEAYRHGLDRGDARMRRNMILKMRAFLGTDVTEPSAQELRKWFDDNPSRFATAEHWSVEVRIEEGESQTLYGLSQRELVLALGPEATEAIQDTDMSTWFGPVDTHQGQMQIQVTEYTPSQVRSFESVEPYLAAEWHLDQGVRRLNSAIQEIKENYDVIVEGENDTQ